ncbi:MAG: hypothetical protein HYX47_21300 [Burkholderiales bacterium]|nr:hypothetical protein [Burkholderiales bacterium]
MRHIAIFVAIVVLAATAAALSGGLAFYLAEELAPDEIRLVPPAHQ